MITLNINKKTYNVDVDPDTPLLWVLRDTAWSCRNKIWLRCGTMWCMCCAPEW